MVTKNWPHLLEDASPLMLTKSPRVDFLKARGDMNWYYFTVPNLYERLGS